MHTNFQKYKANKHSIMNALKLKIVLSNLKKKIKTKKTGLKRRTLNFILEQLISNRA